MTVIDRPADVEEIERIFKALADRTRLRILGLLLGGQVCVCDLHDSLGIPQSKASRHLAYLRRAGLVQAEKRGLWVYYRLAEQPPGVLQALVAAVQHCVGHLPAIRGDARRLEARTGCCVPLPGPLTLDCCGPEAALDRPSRPSSGS
jgi:ArsR family transcriptional regulator